MPQRQWVKGEPQTDWRLETWGPTWNVVRKRDGRAVRSASVMYLSLAWDRAKLFGGIVVQDAPYLPIHGGPDWK